MSNTTQEIDENLILLKETKTNIRDAIEEKGVSISDTDPFSTYADKIQQIEINPGQYQDKTIDKNGIYTADEGYTGLGTVTVQVPQEGSTVEAIALGSAETAVEGDKVVLNPATALQNPVTLEYTKTVNSYWSTVNNARNAPNLGVFSSTKGYAEMMYRQGNTLNQTFTWDSEQNKYVGTAGPGGYNWHVVWGTPKQMYYATCSRYNGRISGDIGTIGEDLSFNVVGTLPEDRSYGLINYFITYKNYCAYGHATNCFLISETSLERKSIEQNYCNGIIEYNGKVYFTLGFNGSPLYYWNSKSFDGSSSLYIRGFGDIKPNAIACLDSNSNYLIAGPYGSPYQFKIFKQLDTSDATNLILQEDTELTAQLPINTEAQTDCNFYVIPIQDGQDFADIFIRYGGRLFYCKWDGTTLTNHGLVTDRGCEFSFNPVERILFTNRAIVEDNTSDYQVFSFQGVMNKPFTAMDITSRNWSAQTLTGFVKSNKGVDEFGNTILEVSTTTDPNEEPWSDVGKLYGFNVLVEEGSL